MIIALLKLLEVHVKDLWCSVCTNILNHISYQTVTIVESLKSNKSKGIVVYKR